MKENDEKIKELLKQKGVGSAQEPPDFVWEHIEAELFPNRKRRILFWWLIPIVGSVVLFFVWNLYEKQSINENSELKTNESNAIHAKNDSSTNADLSSSDEEKNNRNDTTAEKVNKTTIDFLEPHMANVVSSGISNGALSYATKSNSNAANINSKTGTITSQTEVSNSGLLSNSRKEDSKNMEQENRVEDQANLGDTLMQFKRLEPNVVDLEPHGPFSFKSLPLPTLSNFPNHYWMLGIYLGREIRTFDIVQGPRANLVDPQIMLRHRGISFDYQYEFSKHFSILSGIFLHRTRFTSRLFPIKIANANLNDELTFNAPTGELKSQPLNADDWASNFSDTTVVLARIHNRSGYFSIPIALRVHSSSKRNFQVYADFGLQLNYKYQDRNTLIIRRSALERSFESEKIIFKRWMNPSVQTGFGFLLGDVNKTQFYSEITFNRYLGDLYTSPFLIIQGQNIGFNIGVRKKF